MGAYTANIDFHAKIGLILGKVAYTPRGLICTVCSPRFSKIVFQILKKPVFSDPVHHAFFPAQIQNGRIEPQFLQIVYVLYEGISVLLEGHSTVFDG